MSRISDAWTAAVRQLGGEPVAATVADLERRWDEPHRRYHTTRHLEAVLRDSASLADELELDKGSRAIVTLAACAHDVVYEGRPGEDERGSAEWAREALAGCELEAASVDRVVSLVLATITHTVAADDEAGAVLLDADLAILAAEPPAYDDYVAAVRAEYAHVPDDQWRDGRARVLTELLDRDPLYLTDAGRDRWEARARLNLAAELARLG